jgi:hypothetical protein
MVDKFAWMMLGAFALTVATAGCGKSSIAEECTMNGFGQGSCSFTNKGSAAGAVCGRIALRNSGTQAVERGAPFCSGEVAKMTTTKVEFSLPAVRTLCKSDDGGAWSDVCAFRFIADGDDAGAEWDPAVAEAEATKRTTAADEQAKRTEEQTKRVNALLVQLANAKDDAEKARLLKQLEDEKAKQDAAAKSRGGGERVRKPKCRPGDPLCSDD